MPLTDRPCLKVVEERGASVFWGWQCKPEKSHPVYVSAAMDLTWTDSSARGQSDVTCFLFLWYCAYEKICHLKALLIELEFWLVWNFDWIGILNESECWLKWNIDRCGSGMLIEDEVECWLKLNFDWSGMLIEVECWLKWNVDWNGMLI